MMRKRYATLTALHRDLDHVILTAHRGAPADRPENTLYSFEYAVVAGADLIEFDLRASRDGIPLALHDSLLDRTTSGRGNPEKFTLAELKKLNAAWWIDGRRLDVPWRSNVTLPTFEEILANFAGRVLMNIQLYTRERIVLERICRLYRQYQMYDRGYFSVAEMDQVHFIRGFDSEIEICYLPGWETRSSPEMLRLCRNMGCRFVQPVKESLTESVISLCRDLQLRENVFFYDSSSEAAEFLRRGGRGFLTNRIGEIGCVDFSDDRSTAFRREHGRTGGVEV